MQTPKKILFVGCGDLAQGCIPHWNGHSVSAVARRFKPLPSWVQFWQGDVTSDEIGDRLRREAWDAIVITLTPDSPTYEAYRQAYWVNTQYILHNLAVAAKPLILFVSSTSVYGQTDGSWVNEGSLTQPPEPNAQCLLATEQLLTLSGLPIRLLRCAGIYGPGRDFLWQQVIQGKGGNAAYTNRIHRDDVCGIINFLLDRHFVGQQDPHIIIASDDLPVPSAEIRQWLANLMGIPGPLAPSANLRGGNKQLSNALLHQLGYQLKYPNYQVGYRELLKSDQN